MATDRFIKFFEKFPERVKVRETVVGFFGNGPAKLAMEESGQMPRWIYRIPGRSPDEMSWHEPKPRRMRRSSVKVSERWIEIVYDDSHFLDNPEVGSSIDVITRSQDCFTCAIADGFTKALARHLGGQIIKEDK